MSDRHVEKAGTWAHLEELALGLVRGNEGLWQPFIQTLAQRAMPIVRAQWHRLDPEKRFEEVHDVLHEVLVRVIPRLRQNKYRALRAYFDSLSGDHRANVFRHGSARNRGNSSDGYSFRGYVKTIVVRATLDYQRSHPNYRRRPNRSGELERTRRLQGEDGYSDSSHARAHEQNSGRIVLRSLESEGEPAGDAVKPQFHLREMLDYLDKAARVATKGYQQALGNSSSRHVEYLPNKRVYSDIASTLGLYTQSPTSWPSHYPDWTAARDLVMHGTQYRPAIELLLQGRTQQETAHVLGISRRVCVKIVNRAKELLRATFP